MVFGGFVTALGLADDLKKGLIDRFRSLPMSRSAVLAGRTLADIGLNVDPARRHARRSASLVGFRFDGPSASPPGLALCCSSATPSPGSSRSSGSSRRRRRRRTPIGFTILFPVTFVSSAFVPVESMPSWLQPFAEHNPFTTMVNAARALFLGTPAGNDVWLAFVVGDRDRRSCSAVLAVWRYRRAVGT